MKDAGFIFGSYIVTLGAIVIFAVLTLRRAKKASQLVSEEDKSWM